MNTSVNLSALIGEEWSLHIDDAGEPPSLVVLLLWLFLSLCATSLFLVMRPAATQKVREEFSQSGALPHSSHVSTSSKPLSANSMYAAVMWHLLVGIWTLPLYDVVHRTCCYFHLSPYMLARHKLLPLGATFLWDGLWTEWVNWVRLYFICGASLTTAVAAEGQDNAKDTEACVGWQLPLAGVLPYTQYPEYAALNTTRAPTSAEVQLYHRMSVEALVVTLVTVLQLHSFYSFVRHVFSRSSCVVAAEQEEQVEEHLDTEDKSGTKTSIDQASKSKRVVSDFTTALRQKDAPGDDAWVDSPEALAEEALRHTQDATSSSSIEQTQQGSFSPSTATSQTTRLLLQCWPSFVAAGYAALYACVGGLPLLMSIVFPCAVVLTCFLVMFTPV